MSRNVRRIFRKLAPVFVPAARGSNRGQFTRRTDGQERGGFTRPGMAVPRYPQARTNDGANPRRGSIGPNAEPPAAGDVRTRAYRRDPRVTPSDPWADRSDGFGGTRSVPRYRVPRQQPIPAGDVTSPPTRPQPTPVRPSAPEASGVAPSPGRAVPRQPQGDNGWNRPAPRNDNGWGRSAPNPSRPSTAPNNGPSRRQSGASAPPREAAPPSGGAGRAVPRGESSGGSGGNGGGRPAGGNGGGGRPAGGNGGGGRPAGGNGGGGHGPRHP